MVDSVSNGVPFGIDSPSGSDSRPASRTDGQRQPGSSQTEKDSVSLSRQGSDKSPQEGGESKRKGIDGEPLSDTELREIRDLERRDRQVRKHERAHVASGGGLVQGGIQYQFEKGPDGGRYAVSGRVSIDTSPESSPEETLQKMARVKRAALAPSQPSATDRAVAAEAESREMEARIELRQEQIEAMQQNRSSQGSAETVKEYQKNASSHGAGPGGPSAASGIAVLV